MKSIIPWLLSTGLIVFFQSCAPIDVHHAPKEADFETDAIFIPYIQEFESYAGINTSSVPIGFDDLPNNWAGVCYRSRSGGVTLHAYIKIDRVKWSRTSDLQKYNLIFHELGHCVLNRKHVHTEAPRFCPASFMHDTVMSDYCLRENWQVYMTEMFPNFGR